MNQDNREEHGLAALGREGRSGGRRWRLGTSLGTGLCVGLVVVAVPWFHDAGSATATTTSGAAMRPANAASTLLRPITDAAENYPVTITVSEERANSYVGVVYGDATNNPYGGGPDSHPSFTANAAVRVDQPHNAVTIASVAGPLDATLQTTLEILGTDHALTGLAIVPNGATLTISVNGHSSVVLTAGDFSIPLH
jgi:hypothetical protein